MVAINFDVLPQQLSNVERLECVRLLGIYVDSKLSFSEQVDRLLSVCNACRIDCDVDRQTDSLFAMQNNFCMANKVSVCLLSEIIFLLEISSAT